MSKKSASDNTKLLKLVWRVTRGWRGICYGPEFWLSLVVLVCTAPYWLAHHWWAHVLAIVPTILGFTITGFAIFLAFGSDDFKRFLARGKEIDENAYMSTGSAFVIFICVQLIAIFFALIVNAFQFPTPGFLSAYRPCIQIGNYIVGAVGYFLFIYSIGLALRASMRIFRLSRWYMSYLIATDNDGMVGPERRIAHLTSMPGKHGSVLLWAGADDGTIWHIEKKADGSFEEKWTQVESLPSRSI